MFSLISSRCVTYDSAHLDVCSYLQSDSQMLCKMVLARAISICLSSVTHYSSSHKAGVSIECL